MDFLKRIFAACALLSLLAYPVRAVAPADQLQFADGLFARGLYDLAAREYRVLADAPDAPGADAASYRIGEARRQQGQADAARDAYRETEQRFPDSPYALRARFRLAEDAINSGEPERALEPLRGLSASKDLPEDLAASTAYYLAHAAQQLKKEKDAASAYRQLMKIAPESAYAYLGRVELAVALIGSDGKPAEIVRLLEDAANQEAVPGAAMEALRLLGDYLYRNKDYAASADAYSRLFERFPDEPAVADARLSAAWAFLKANRFDEALAQTARAPVAKEAAWLYLDANAKRLTGGKQQARTAYEQLLKKYPSAPEAESAAYELALLFFQEGDFTNARARASEAKPNGEIGGDLLWIRAESAREIGRSEEAVKLYDEIAAAKVDAGRAAAARFRAARLRQESGAWADASERYRALATVAPKNSLAPDALFASAFSRGQLKENKEALADWTRLLKDYPEYAARDQVLFGKAQAELALDRTKDAGETFALLLKDFPDSPVAAETHLQYGSLLEQSQNFAAAEFHYIQALRKKPDPALSRRIQFRRVGVLQRQDRSAEAVEALNQLVADGASAEIPVQLLDWAARWNLEHSNYTAVVSTATALAEQKISPGWTQIAWYLAGRAQLELGQADKAGASFMKSAKITAKTAEGLEAAWRWGEWALSKENWTDAQTAFEQSAEQAASPESAEIRARSYFGLGRVAEGRGNWADAARQYLAVAILYDDPSLTPDALEAAARMFEKSGDAAAASRTRRELKERYPSGTPAGEPGASS